MKRIEPQSSDLLGSLEKAFRQLVREVFREELEAVRQAEANAPTKHHEFVTVDEAALIAKVNEVTIRRWIQRGILPAFKTGRSYRLRRADVERTLTSDPATPDQDLDELARAYLNGTYKRSLTWDRSTHGVDGST